MGSPLLTVSTPVEKGLREGREKGSDKMPALKGGT